MNHPDLPHTHHDHDWQDCWLTFMYVDDGRWEVYLAEQGLIGELEEHPDGRCDQSPLFRAVLPEMPRWLPEDLTDDWRVAVGLLVRES